MSTIQCKDCHFEGKPQAVKVKHFSWRRLGQKSQEAYGMEKMRNHLSRITKLLRCPQCRSLNFKPA